MKKMLGTAGQHLRYPEAVAHMYLATRKIVESTRQPVTIATELVRILDRKMRDPVRILAGTDYAAKEYWVLRLGKTFISCNRQDDIADDLGIQDRKYEERLRGTNSKNDDNAFRVCQTVQLSDVSGSLEYYEGFILADGKLHFTAWNVYQNMVVKGVALDGLSPRKGAGLCVGFFPHDWEILGVHIPTELFSEKRRKCGLPFGRPVLYLYDTHYGCPKTVPVGGI